MKQTRFALVVATIVAALCWLFQWERPVGGGSTASADASSAPDLPSASLPQDGKEAGNPRQPAAEAPAPAVANAFEFGTWAVEAPREPDFQKLDAFQNWIERWKNADAEGREALRAEGQQLAQERREEFKALIAKYPQIALEMAVPRVVRQDLPQEIVAQLEKPVSATGNYDVYKGQPAPGAPTPAEGLTLRYFEAGDMSYKARVYGEMEDVMSRKNIPLRGVAMDRELAVAESPVRSLEVGERITAGTVVEETCPVSGKTTEAVATGQAVTEETPTVEVGENVIALCNGTHVTVLDEKYRTLIQAAGPGGAAFYMDAFPGTSSRAIGNFRCLYIRATYPDQMAQPNTEDQAFNDLKNTAKFYLDSSYGKMTTTYTVTPLITLPQTLKWYQDKDTEVNGLGVLQTQARAEARKLGYDSTQYDCIILRVNGGLRSGASWGGGDSVWLGWGGMGVMNHECGHSLGLGHANYWSTTDGTPYGNGSNQEYGNSFDVMGTGADNFSHHYNSVFKRNLGWLPNSYVHFPKTNGVFRIFAFDQPRLEEGKRYSMQVSKDSNIAYNIEYHTTNPTISNQALVLYGGRLIDTTQGSSGGKGDGGIQVGRTFSDWEGDMHFTLLGINGTNPPSIDVAFNRGPFPGNVAPTLALAADNTTIAAGGSVTFTATANDANGDPLSYYWEFDDGTTAANSAVVTKTFSSAAQVTAMVTVSDMKGGTARRHVVINVGSHGKQTVAGNISAGGQPLANVRVSITNGKFAYTDADGNYALAGVSTGSQTLTATLNGYALTPSFTNPLTVVAGTNTANWTAAGSTFVTLTKTGDPTEGGSNGGFLLTRTGDTSADLVVRVSPVGGTATKTTDYTFTPDFVTNGSYREFTIPAGQSSLAISVAAVNDTAQEGPESITMQLASNPGYLVMTSNAVVMTVGDNDTTLPLVAVTAPDPYAIEGGGDDGSFVFTRTGSTAAALNLSVAWSGTATNGTDYTTLPTTVTIPSGQGSVTVPVTTINDSAIEVPEDVVATISTNAAYVRDTAATTSTVTISDDDAPVVTVSVTDAVASEAGPDSGVFLISRTGDTSAPLKVYYGLSGTASHGTDFAKLNGELVIPAGATSAPVVITPYNDDLGEGLEDVTLAVTTFNNAYSIGANYQATLSISDNADTPLVSVRAGTAGVEGGANATLVFRSIGSSSGNVTVNYTVSGTATAGTDYTALTGTVTVPANGTSDVTVTIPITNDTTPEPTETVAVKITPDAAYRVYNDGSAEAVIRDNDSGGERVMVSAYNSSATEAGSVVGNFYISRAVGTTGALTVNYTLSGTATSGTDYTGLTGSVVIPDAASGVVVPFTPVDDAIAEGTETVTLTVVAATGYGVDRPASATLEIADNDASAVTVGFQVASQVMSELPGVNGEYRDIPVVLSASSASTITVQYTGGGGSASGDDVDWSYVDAANGNAIIPGGTLTFAPGVTSQNLRIRIKSDGVSEVPETLVLELRAPNMASLTSGMNRQNITLFDDVIPNLITEERWNNTAVYTNQTWSSSAPNYTGYLTSFTPSQGVADNYSRRLTGLIVAPTTGSYRFWVASDDASRLYLSTDSTAANKVQIATVSGYTSFQDWDANASQQSVLISLVGGQSYYMEVQHQEGGGGDHVSVAWEGPGFSRTPLSAVMQDNAPRSVRFAVASTTRTEGDGSEPLLMAVLDRPAGTTPITVDYTVGGTASAGSDFTLSPGTVTFTAGEQAKLLPLSILTDAIGESPEAIVVSLTNPSGAQVTAPATHTITLLDANAPSVATQQFTATSAMSTGTTIGTMSASVASGRTVAGWAIVAGNEGGWFAIDAIGQVSLQSPGSLPSPATRQLVVRVIDNLGSTGDGTVNIVCNPPATLGVVEQRWAGATAYNNQDWSGTPNYAGSLTTFTTPQNVAENYSRRLTGYIQPQVTGDYTFWVASDDDGRLFLSTDSSAANKVQIASVSGYTNYQAWDSQSSQKSAVVTLQAGVVYWMEAQQLEGGGGDHLSVAWQGPGFSRQAIPVSAMFPTFGAAPAVPSVAVTSPANGATFISGDSVTINASTVGGTQTITSMEFYYDGTLIGSDSAAPFTVSTTTIPVGTHTLTAKAIHSGGAVTTTGVNVAIYPPTSLQAHWRFDEGTGTSAADSSGNGRTATLQGATWATGQVGAGAIATNGTTTQYAQGASLDYASGVTIAAWIKPSVLSGHKVFVSEQGSYAFKTNGTGLLFTTPGIVDHYSSGVTLTANQWVHVAVTFQPSTTGGIKFYVNGALASTGNSSALSASANPTIIGKTNNWSGQEFNGNIDDVQIYSSILSATQIGNLYNGSFFAPPSGALMPESPMAIANSAPVFINDPITGAAASLGNAYTGQSLAGSATDADVGDTVTYAKVSGPAWLSVAANGALSGTPPAGSVGTNVFTVRASDASSANDEAELRIEVKALPLPWSWGDVGAGQLAGSSTQSAGTYTLNGSGVLNTTSDQYHYSYQMLSGDGEIVAKVPVLGNTGTSARVGVMIRDSLASNSRYVFMGVTSNGGYRWMRRTTTGGNAATTNSGSGTAPNIWVRLVRSGNTITSYRSADGATWTSAGSVNVTMASNCYIGLAVASGSATTANTSQFSNVIVTP